MHASPRSPRRHPAHALVALGLAVALTPAQAHWAFAPPAQPTPPAVRDTGWPRNDVDRFVLARLQAEGLRPAPEATREDLLRRATFTLTGLPPTRAEAAAFLGDPAADAFERLVDRLLASPHYGEECARRWLDLARAADTHGMQRDQERTIWPWRDYVITAHNTGMSYRQFATELLAGDRLPDATQDQRVATAFLRCNPSSDEGGLIPEEFLVRYAQERTDTFGTVFLGLTVGCAQCHDHKSDPLSQRDYYRLSAYFSSFGEDGNDGGVAAPKPAIGAPTRAQQERLRQLEASVATAAAAATTTMPPMRVRPFDAMVAVTDHDAVLTPLADGSWRAEGPTPATGTYTLTATGDFAGLTSLRLRVLPDADLPATGPGRAENGNFVLTEVELTIGDAATPVRVAIDAAEAPFAQTGFEPWQTLDGDPATGWAILGHRNALELQLALGTPLPEGTGRLQVRLRHDSRHRQHLLGRFALTWTDDPAWLAPRRSDWERSGPHASESTSGLSWHHAPDLDDRAVHAFGDAVGYTFLRRTLHVPTARPLRLGLGSDDGLLLAIDGHELLRRDVQRGAARNQDQVDVELTAGDHEVLLRIHNTGGPSGFAFELADAGLGLTPVAAKARAELRRAEQALADGKASVPQCPVADASAMPRPVSVLRRGRYDQPLEPVTPGTPTFLPALPADAPADRTALAAWLFADGHPLTARVHVNRLWAWHFGRGLVDTPHDFGVRGSRPSHPELLDWLACEFVRSGWDERHLLRLLLTSATWRQSARTTADQRARDPDNVLWARAARLRLPAEAIRDQALLVSGLLVDRLGGPPTRPYQPAGVWESVTFPGSNTEFYRRDDGEALWRRSVYTFWKRTAPPAAMVTLDAPSRERPTVERTNTNTPLQALVLRNDETFVEAARVWAVRLRQQPGDDGDRLRGAFEDLLQRPPTGREQELLAAALARHRRTFTDDRAAAIALTAVGAAPHAEDPDVVGLAAWTMVLHLLLNLDEALHRG